MSERARTEGQMNEKKESKEKLTEVSRVFLFQSVSPERFTTNHVEDWNFIDTLLIRKGGTKTTNQLTPVGGKINKGEKPLAGARREIVEETHLRAMGHSMRELKNAQEYKMELKDHKETVSRKARYFVGQILPRPMDLPYALDVEEDKIESFVYLNVAEFQQLLTEGSVLKDGMSMPLLDSLRLDKQRTENLTTDNEVLKKIHTETLAQFRKIEATKKLSVLEHLMWAVQLKKEFSQTQEEYQALDEDRQGIFLQIEGLRAVLERPENEARDEAVVLGAITEAEQLWREVVRAYACTPEQVKRALKNSNIEEMRDHATERFDLESGAGIPTINFIFPLLITDEPDLRERRTLMRNPQMRKLMKISDTFWHLREVQRRGEEAEKSIGTLAMRFKIRPEQVVAFSKNGIPPEVVKYFTTTAFAKAKERAFPEEPPIEQLLLPAEFFAKIPELNKKINDYFETLDAAADVQEVPLDQHPLVKNADILRLWDVAFNADAQLPTDPKERKIVRWEASRKLGLMMMLCDAERMQNSIIEAGIKPIQDIENALGTFSIIKQNGSSMVKEGVFGHENYAVKTYARQKDLLSYFRKIIVRDELSEEEAMDTFGKSIVLTETSEKALGALMFERCNFEEQLLDEKYQLVGEVRMPRFVRELIDSILEEAGRQGQLVRIVKYKGFPEDGKKFSASSGPGATGNIRMGKFYIEHTAPDGTVRNREMQIFLPRIIRNNDGGIERIESGEVDFEAKKADDREYSVSRLFSTKALRSFMELMYPAEIYGDSIRPIYKAKAK
jgi:8-oxo-dGTP pyrophosphatase MutT (NUDIX family)